MTNNSSNAAISRARKTRENGSLGEMPNDSVADTESGMSLIETTIAMVVILVGLLAAAEAFTYAILYNAGNASRAQALAILQQETELLRSKKFSPAQTDADLVGGARPIRTIAAPNGGSFTIEDTIDDDPLTNGVQVNANSSIKEITVTVRLASPSPGWQTAVPAVIVMRRTRGN
jgi:type II secretory pathway pseudopilin PulG